MSVMGLPGGCSATRRGRMKGADVEGLASARSARSVGCVMTKRRRRVYRLDALGELEQLLAHGVDGGPAPDRGHAVLGRHGLAVMPGQAFAQCQRIGLAVLGHVPFFQHLRLQRVVPVHGDQRVVDHVAVPGGDVGRGRVRVGQAQRRMHHRPERGLGRGGRGGGQRQQRQERRPQPLARGVGPGWPRGPRDAGGTGRRRGQGGSRWRMRAPSRVGRPACKPVLQGM